MPSFTFTSPEGKSYTVNGPPGATQEQAWAILQQQLKATPPHTDYGNPATSGTETYFDIPSMSFKQRPSDPFVAGVGKAFADTGAGLKQLALKAGNKIGLVSDQDVQQNQQEVDSQRQLDKPLMSTTAGKVGQMAGDAALLAAAPEGLAGTAGGGAALAGAQPTSGDESRLANVAVGAAGGAAGYGVGKALGLAAQPVTDRLGALGKQFRQILTNEGVPLDVSQATGSRVARTLKNVAADAPLAGESDFPQQQAQQFTRAALEKMGVNNATEASPAVMQLGKQRLKSRYDEIAARNGVDLDNGLATEWDRIRSDALSSLTPENAKVITNKLDDILTMMERNNSGTQQLSGEAYQKIQSSLGQIAKDGGKAPFVTQIRQALTDAMQRQASPGDAVLLARTNQQYAAMKAIEKAIGDDNQISPAKLFNALDTAKGANQTVYGQGPNQALVNLAQAGKALIGKGTANSGTAARVAGLGAVGALGTAGYDLATGKTQDAAHLGEVAVSLGLAPAVAQKLIFSEAGRTALTRWAQSRLATAAKVAAARAGGVTGGAVAPQLLQPTASVPPQ